jgi:hypothetical protein
MRRYPAAAWLLVYIGSLLILNGSHPTWRPWQLGVGIALPLIALAVTVYLAAGPSAEGPPVRGTYWALTGTAAFYALCALIAALFLGFDEAVAVLLAGMIPLTAVAIWLAHARQKTTVAGRGTRVEDAAADNTDPIPGMGIDDHRPMGDSPAVHDDISPHDLPKDHPGRKEAERLAAERDGTTTGHRDGGAEGGDTHSRADRLEVSEEEVREGAHVRH